MKMLAVFVVTLMPALVLASNARASKSEILSVVETAAKASCHNPESIVFIPVWPEGKRPPVTKFAKCVSTASFDVSTNKWTVIVGRVYKDEHGKDVFPAGGWTMYVLSPTGELLQTLPGE